MFGSEAEVCQPDFPGSFMDINGPVSVTMDSLVIT